MFKYIFYRDYFNSYMMFLSFFLMALSRASMEISKEVFFFFLAVLGLRFCARAFSRCGEWGPLFIAVHGPLTVAASLVAEHRLQMRRLSSYSSRTQLLRGMWDLPRPGFEPVSPALAGRLSTTAPPGKPHDVSFVTFTILLLFELFAIINTVTINISEYNAFHTLSLFHLERDQKVKL